MRKLAIIIVMILIPVSISAQDGIGDLVFNFDASGSMRFPLVLGGGTIANCAAMLPITDTSIRYRKMRDAIDPTLGFLRDWYDNVFDDTPIHISPARIGSVHFPDGTVAAHKTPLDRQLNDIAGNPFTEILNNIIPSDIEPDIGCSPFSTPMGPALQEILDTILKPNDTFSDNQVVLLISDGEPNFGPNPNLDLSFWTQPGHIDNTVYRKVWTIGIGDDDNHYEYLYTLATNTGGNFYGWWEGQTGAVYGPIAGTLDPSTSFSAGTTLWSSHFEKPLFKDILQYKTMVDPIGVVKPDSVNVHTFQVTPLDSSLIVTVKWPKQPISGLAVKLRMPNGNEITPGSPIENSGIIITRGRYYIYFLIPNRSIQFGEWNIEVEGDSIRQATAYNYSIYTRSELDIQSNIEIMNFSTDDILNGSIRIINTGETVTLDSVKVFILPPETWLGNWLSDPAHDLSDDELRFVKQEKWIEDISLIERKRMLLTGRNIDFQRQYPTKRIEIILFDDGLHLDGFNNDGVYNNEFLRPAKPGVYEILYTVHGKTSAGHIFRRELYFQKFVSVAVEADNTEIEFEKISEGLNLVTADMKIKFSDKLGNIALPENSNLIKLDLDHAEPTSEITDRLNGSYIQRFQFDQRLGRPRIGLQYGNVIFPPQRIIFTRVGFIPVLDLSLVGRVIFFDDAITLDDAQGFGATFGVYLNRYFRFEGSFGTSQVKDQAKNKGTLLDTGFGLTLGLFKNTTVTPFISIGGKYLKTFDLPLNDEGVALKYGAGIRIAPWSLLGLSLEGSDLLTSGFYADDITHNRQIKVNILLNFWKREKVTY